MDFLPLLIATGLVIGATYGLIAMGFALIYKSTGVVNFAQGEMVMLDGLYLLQPRQHARGCRSSRCSSVTIPDFHGVGLVLERSSSGRCWASRSLPSSW